jgi:hypothetical protein
LAFSTCRSTLQTIQHILLPCKHVQTLLPGFDQSHHSLESWHCFWLRTHPWQVPPFWWLLAFRPYQGGICDCQHVQGFAICHDTKNT